MDCRVFAWSKGQAIKFDIAKKSSVQVVGQTMAMAVTTAHMGWAPLESCWHTTILSQHKRSKIQAGQCACAVYMQTHVEFFPCDGCVLDAYWILFNPVIRWLTARRNFYQPVQFYPDCAIMEV